jgi:serine/threonine protein phosphatase PrpC
MDKNFEIAGGSVLGKNHLQVGKNNQDAYDWLVEEDLIIALVADGCGSKKSSEVGAKIGVKLITEALKKNILDVQICLLDNNDLKLELIFKKIQQDVLAQIRILANNMGGNFYDTVLEYFLFTIVGVIIIKEKTVIFSFGDGMIFLNGNKLKIGPFENNAPPYLAYGLFDQTLIQINPNLLKFQVITTILTNNINSLIIGTDGLEDFCKNAEKKLPGKEEKVGLINQFWQEDQYFKNPDMIRRRLFVINKDVIKTDRQNISLIKEFGLLPDDTTLIVLRRKGGE